MADDFWNNVFDPKYDEDEDISWIREWVRLAEECGHVAAFFLANGGKLIEKEGEAHDDSKQRPDGGPRCSGRDE